MFSQGPDGVSNWYRMMNDDDKKRTNDGAYLTSFGVTDATI
jgi:hypothetical protein